MSTLKDVWQLAREAGRDLAHRASDTRSAKQAVTVAKDAENLERVRNSREARRAVRYAGASASPMFVKEVAKICGKAGAAGAVVDGAVGSIQAVKYVQKGVIDRRQALKHVGAEAGCGFVTSSSGTAGTIAVFMVTGTMGPAALAAGMGASMGSRYLYKQVVGETLPDEEEIEEILNEQADAKPKEPTDEPPDEGMEDIGPGARAYPTGSKAASDLDDIGPSDDAEETGDAQVSDPAPDAGTEDAAPTDSDDDSGDDGPNGADGVWESIGPDDS